MIPGRRAHCLLVLSTGRSLLVSGRALYVIRPDGTGGLELRAEGMPLALGGLPDWTSGDG